VDRIPAFLDGLPRLEPAQATALEAPFTLPELRAAVAGAAAAKSPGLNGLSYEFYKKVLPIIEQPLLAAFNDMLAADLLPLHFAAALFDFYQRCMAHRRRRSFAPSRY
jgi:hypothetical protein